MIEGMLALLGDYTFQVVAVGAVSLGILSGITGTFAVLRKQSLLGDSIAHASLAGIALAFMLTQSKSTEVLLLGALVVGLVATFIIGFFSRNTRVNFESSLALVMASFFGLGLMLLTEIQKYPNSNQAGLDRFLFGQAATILQQDVYLTLGVMGIVIILLIVFWKELKVFTFDPVFAQTMGFPGKILNTILSAFIVSSVIVGIQMVGVVLMSALLIAPAVAARQWTRSLLGMTVLSAFLGGISGLLGTLISSSVSQFPTGPAIVLCMSLIVMISLLFAPGRGLVNHKMRQYQARIAYEADMMLVHFFSHHVHDLNETFSKETLLQKSLLEHRQNAKTFGKLMQNLKKRAMIRHVSSDEYQLTDRAKAELFEKEGAVHHVTSAN